MTDGTHKMSGWTYCAACVKCGCGNGKRVSVQCGACRASLCEDHYATNDDGTLAGYVCLAHECTACQEHATKTCMACAKTRCSAHAEVIRGVTVCDTTCYQILVTQAQMSNLRVQHADEMAELREQHEYQMREQQRQQEMQQQRQQEQHDQLLAASKEAKEAAERAERELRDAKEEQERRGGY